MSVLRINKKIKASKFVFYSICLLSLIICCAFSTFQSASYVSFGVFLVIILKMVHENPKIVLKYMFFFFMVVANVMGCFICEFGDIYLIEINTYSHYVGALPTLIIAQSVFLISIYETEVRTKKTMVIPIVNNIIDEKIFAVLNCFVFVLYFAIFVHIIPYSALRLNVDRMTYASMGYNDGIWNYLTKWAQFFIAIPIGCIAYSKKKRYKLFGIITLLLYCLYYLWIGNKFGSFFNLFCVYCLLVFSRLDINEKKVKRIFLVFICTMLLFVLAAAYIFTNYQSQGTNISYYLQKRLAEQGQLFWKTYAECAGKLHISDIRREIIGQFNAPTRTEDLVGARFGIYNIMYVCAPASKVDGVILYGSRYTEAGYASAYYYLGTVGSIFFAIVFARLFVFATNAIVNSTQKNNPIGMILIIRLFFITCTAWSMFLIKDFFTGASILTYLWIIYAVFTKKLRPSNDINIMFSMHL